MVVINAAHELSAQLKILTLFCAIHDCLVPPGSTRKAKRRERRAEPSKIHDCLRCHSDGSLRAHIAYLSLNEMLIKPA